MSIQNEYRDLRAKVQAKLTQLSSICITKVADPVDKGSDYLNEIIGVIEDLATLEAAIQPLRPHVQEDAVETGDEVDQMLNKLLAQKGPNWMSRKVPSKDIQRVEDILASSSATQMGKVSSMVSKTNDRNKLANRGKVCYQKGRKDLAKMFWSKIL